MPGVGRGPVALLLVVAVLVGGLYGVAAVLPATADASTAQPQPAPTVTDQRSGLVSSSSPSFFAAASAGADRDTDRSGGEPAADPPRRDRAGDSVGDTRVTDDGSDTRTETASTLDQATDLAAVGADASGQAREPSTGELSLFQRFQRLPDEPGRVAVTHNYSVPDAVVSLRAAIPRRGAAVGTDGFEAINGSVYRWDGSTVNPTITYELPINETGGGDYVGANGSLLFADVGEWSLFRRPPTSTSWEFRGRDSLTFDRQSVTEGPGATGEWLVYLGEGTLYTRETDRETFRLVVPAAANMSETPDDVLDAMERAAADLSVGARDEAVFAVAAPTDSVSWAARGISVEGTGMWVRDGERVNTTDNIWVHEYVHTRQEYEPTNETRWTREGFATYYAAYQALQYRDVSFGEFADALALPDDPADNVTLSDPETWGNRSDYERGALVAGQLDRRIRAATDGNRTLDAVLAGMNDDTDAVNGSELYRLVDQVAGNDTEAALRTAVETNGSVRMWNRTAHVRSFGGMPPDVRAGLPRANESGYAVEGPYRNASFDRPPRLVEGETLVVDAMVRNVGGSAGHYDVDLGVNGTLVDTADGEIPSGASRQVPLSNTFDRRGEYEVAIGNDSTTVTVLPVPKASLVGFNVSRTTLEQYQRATVEVTVANARSIPAERTVTLRRDGAVVATGPVYVGPDGTATAEFDLRFPNEGTSSVSIDDRDAVAVTVRPGERPTPVPTATPNGTTAPAGPSSALGPGLGVLVALVALAVVSLVGRYRRRST